MEPSQEAGAPSGEAAGINQNGEAAGINQNGEAAGINPTVEAASIEWTVFLLRRHPWRGLLAVAVCAVTISFVWSFTSSAWITGVATFILLASLSSFFFPTRFQLDGEKIRMSNALYRRTRKWSEFRGMRQHEDRLKLITLPYDSRLDNYRGMLLILPEERDPVLAFIRRRIEEAHGEPA